MCAIIDAQVSHEVFGTHPSRLEPSSFLGLIGVPVAWWLEENCLMSYGIA